MATLPQRLSPRHLAVARLDASGLRRGEIAEILGLNPSTVSHLRRSPAYMVARASVQDRVERAAIRAIVSRIVGRPCPGCSGPVERRPQPRRRSALSNRRRLAEGGRPIAMARETGRPARRRGPIRSVARQASLALSREAIDALRVLNRAEVEANGLPRF
jgi:hypothetical protein